MRKIALLTSGGDCPGMNACIYNVVKCASLNNIEVIGFYHGYKGVLEKNYTRLTVDLVESFQDIGGTMLKSSRCMEFYEDSGVKKAADNIKELDIEALIVIGGDGSFKGGLELTKHGINIIGIPATIDNDIFYTDYTMGFDTAVSNAVTAIKSIQETMASHGRVSIIEVMGRHCGDIALNAAVTSNADIVLLPEVPFTYEEVVEKVNEMLKRGNTCPSIIISENQTDLKALASFVAEKTKKETKTAVLGYIQRGGTPTVADKMLAVRLSVGAVKCVLDGVYNVAMGVKSNKMICVPIEEATKSGSDFDYDLYNLFSLLNDI